ncbi:MAG: hypothetical protein ABEJ72_00865, partial [Candidatus Aenigmatarchaeota archaeon]
MKKILIIFLVLFFLGMASGQVRYDINTNKDRTLMNTSIKLTCESGCPDRWQLSWSIPEGARILGIEDSQGMITDYARSGEKVSITTENGLPRSSEKITI